MGKKDLKTHGSKAKVFSGLARRQLNSKLATVEQCNELPCSGSRWNLLESQVVPPRGKPFAWSLPEEGMVVRCQGNLGEGRENSFVEVSGAPDMWPELCFLVLAPYKIRGSKWQKPGWTYWWRPPHEGLGDHVRWEFVSDLISTSSLPHMWRFFSKHLTELYFFLKSYPLTIRHDEISYSYAIPWKQARLSGNWLYPQWSLSFNSHFSCPVHALWFLKPEVSLYVGLPSP